MKTKLKTQIIRIHGIKEADMIKTLSVVSVRPLNGDKKIHRL